MRLGKLLREGEHFLGMIGPDFLGADRGEAGAFRDHAGIPRLSHAEAIHAAGLHIRGNLRRGHSDERHVVIRVNAARAEPVAQPHRVRAGLERDAENHRASLIAHLDRERA